MSAVESYSYIVAIPESSRASLELVAPELGCPDGISACFLQVGSYWVNEFLAFETASEGTPSREMLLDLLSAYPNVLWWRSPNAALNGGFVVQAKHSLAADGVDGLASAISALGGGE